MFLRNELGFCSVYNIWYEIFVSFFNIPKINYCVLFNGSKYIVLKHFITFSSQLLNSIIDDCMWHTTVAFLRFKKEKVSNTHQLDISSVKRARCPEQIRTRIYKTD